MAIRQFYIWFWSWSPESYCVEKQFNLYETASLDNSNVKEQTTVKTKKPKLQKQKSEFVDPPTRQQLQALKEVLGLKEGSLQYKKRGQGVYHVVYNQGKYRWRHLDSWIRLKEKLETENSVK